MAPLALLLLVKIVGTLAAVAMPMLLLPIRRLDQLSELGPSNPVLYRLYGIAMLALLVGYTGGLVQVFAGEFPVTIVAMGVVSNGGASIALMAQEQTRQRRIALAFLASITVGLLVASGAQAWALAPLW